MGSSSQTYAGPVAPNGAAAHAPAAENEHKNVVIDAGLRSLDHYKRALPKWRYELRQSSLALIRWETPYLAWLQARLRSHALDSYFAITANLGTHTFFMIFLPILFWCGFPPFGKGLVHILASGVFFTGFVKDFLSLPRPLSPPLHRITMSGSAALEYGFPSTHSANAVSVAVYGILCLHAPNNPLSPTTRATVEGLAYFYALSIIFGRIYCGMHGFMDVIIGSVMGAGISWIEFYYGPMLEAYLYERNLPGFLIVAATIIILVRIHPEPADDCPCFDDSVAFAGVVLGVEAGTAHFAQSPLAVGSFDMRELGWLTVVARVAIGILAIFAWREVAKPTLLKVLPHVFRIIETWGLSLPRRFFMPASEYKNIPLRLRVDNVMPNVSDIPDFVNNIRKAGRGRSVSIGPQSAADAYETLAYRERRRKESISSQASLMGKQSVNELPGSAGPEGEPPAVAISSGVTGAPQKVSDYERMMGEGNVVVSPIEAKPLDGEPELYVGSQDELGEKEVFAKLVRPRVRYDVEVVTKLVVYAGIGFIAVDLVPLAFELIGLKARHLQHS